MAQQESQDHFGPIEISGEGEKLLDEDLFDVKQPESSKRRRWCNFFVVSLVANVVLLGLVTYLTLPLAGTPLDRDWIPSRRNEIAGDINGIWPKLPQRIITFQPDDLYVGNLTSTTFIADTKKYWLDLVPKGLGFVEVSSPEQYPHLPEPYIKYDKPVYTTSVTHQLHCLYMIMHGFNDLALNHGKFVMDMGEDDDGLTREGEDPAAHLSHCFDYLRQAIMCHGDTALEGLQSTFGHDVGGSDGWNVKHVCKPWDRIYSWLEEQRVDDREWI